MKPLVTLLAALPFLVLAADLPPDKGTEIPESAKRPVVVTGKPTLATPKADLPEGYTLSIAAASPLVLHPIMGCLDNQGRLFIGDGTGVNWNKAQLEANPPNRVLMLEDTDKDGVFDKSTVFADKLTFPQGADWYDGSLYVCSPPGLWKFTDTDGDGVADKREMLVSGFEYTGNAADVHGPFIDRSHSPARLYWCHGRKGHKATDVDGNVVHEGLACGIWSCNPDGRDLQWHSLGCGDNPVEVDFTPNGDIIGVQNLYYTNPRGDTLVHWLYGGVYERSDQLKAIQGLPRTLEHMPVMYNFGHVAVSGSCFWKSGQAPQARAEGHKVPMALQFMVTHFNTQRLVRMELTADGATYKATENEFLKMHSPDIHFTDVMEDPRDGSLLVVDTGGWFRIGCPSSLMAKPDIAGAIYRISPIKKSSEKSLAWTITAGRMGSKFWEEIKAGHGKGSLARKFCDDIARAGKADEKQRAALLTMLSREDLDPALEHATLLAMTSVGIGLDEVRSAEKNPLLLRRLLRVHDQQEQDDAAGGNLLMGIAAKYMDATDDALAQTARQIVINHPDADEWQAETFSNWLKEPQLSAQRLAALEVYCTALAGKPNTNKLITTALQHPQASVVTTAVRVLGTAVISKADDAWLAALDKLLSSSATPSLLDAIKHLKTNHFDTALQAIANDTKQPQSLRLKALDAMSTRKITGETFTMVLDALTNPASSASAKIQAADMMAHSGHTKEERIQLAKVFSSVGPVELKSLLALIRPCKEEDELRAMAGELAKNPALISQQESLYRTALADKPTDIFEGIVRPAYAKASEGIEAKKRTLAPLADKVLSSGDPSAGKAVYESGKGTCIACHQIGEKGRSIGPNLSHIGAIRTERDILESILFPSNTLARDYEAHIIETSGGETITGVIKSHTAEGLLVVDVAGQEKNIPQAQMVSDTTLTTSLMPMGLDTTLPEKDLLDLVAWLRSLK